MKIKFTNGDNPFGCFYGSEYDIHDTHELEDNVYYIFSPDHRFPPIAITIGNIKGYAEILTGEVEDIFEKISEGDNYGEKNTVNEQGD